MLISLTKRVWVELGSVGVMRHDEDKRVFAVINRNGAVMITLTGDEADAAAASVLSFEERMKSHADLKVAAIADRPGG